MIPPKIAIRFLSDGDLLLQTQLSLDSSFQFQIEGASLPLKQSIEAWLKAYLSGSHVSFTGRMNIQGTPFQEAIWRQLQAIPFGKTISYGALSPKAPRAAGSACGKNNFPLLIPCHRVIQADGSIGGFALDLKIKRTLLEFEAS